MTHRDAFRLIAGQGRYTADWHLPDPLHAVFLRALALALAALSVGCASFEIVTMESNYITYRHRFTDAAAAEVQKNAERLCGQRSEVAVRTSNACSLTDCTTNYQCVDKADAGLYR